MNTRGTRPRLGRVAVAALAALAVTTGCGVATEAGAAAVVDGERITVSRLQTLTTEMVDAGVTTDPATQAPFEAGGAQREVLKKLISSRLIDEAAQDAGVSVTEGEVDALLATVTPQEGQTIEQTVAVGSAIPPSYVRRYARDALLTDRIGAELVPGDAQTVAEQRQAALTERLQQVSAAAEVTVNPRYGQWDPARFGITPLISGGLANPPGEDGAAQPAPAPAPAP